MGVKVSHKRRVPKRKDRNEFSPSLKGRIRQENDYKCQMCGGPAWECHHVRKRSNGGRGIYSNCALLCSDCHRELHLHPRMERELVDEYKERYGPHFFKDRWDLEQEYWIDDLTKGDREIREWLKYNA